MFAVTSYATKQNFDNPPLKTRLRNELVDLHTEIDLKPSEKSETLFEFYTEKIYVLQYVR